MPGDQVSEISPHIPNILGLNTCGIRKSLNQYFCGEGECDLPLISDRRGECNEFRRDRKKKKHCNEVFLNGFTLWKTFYYNFFLGLFFIVPKIDQFKKVDLRTVSFNVPPQEVLLKFYLTFLMLYFAQSTAKCILTFSATVHLISSGLL